MQGKSKGIVAYAVNTPTVDYIAIAKITLELASQQLQVPYTLITADSPEDWANYRIDIDTHVSVPWNNFNRYMCYDHSPYDQTIVIDVDYLVLTNKLSILFSLDKDIVLCHTNDCLYKPSNFLREITPVWATVFYFTKSPKAQAFFTLVGKIQRNWDYYRNFFGIPERQFRNDYAFAIAELITNGYSNLPDTRLPWHITTVDKTPNDIQLADNWIVVRDENSATIIPRQDLHVMSKAWLQSNKLTQFVSKVMS